MRILILFLFTATIAYNQSTINPANIDIVRDQWGIPHIFAKTNPEVAYGLAWAQAEDNFETMQQTLMFAKGLLGRKYGPDGAAGDFFSQLLKVEELVEARMQQDVSPEFMAYLQGFCDGANAYAEAHPKEVFIKDIFPVTPKDVLKSYPAKIAEFMGLGGTVSAILNGTYYDKKSQSIDFGQKGSNAFAFRSGMTTDGRTYLISNPHVSITGPEAFYEVHVVSEEGLDFHGAMFPGSVSPQVGTNRYLGWSHTNNYYDHTDVYLLKMHPTEKLKYEFDGQWLDLEEMDIKLTVKLKGLPFPVSVKRKAYWSKYGPTLESKQGNFFSLRMATYQTIKTPEQWYRMNLAKNLKAFKEALALDGLPYFNITYADKDDNVFYIFNGLFPERTPGYDWMNVLPGNTSKTLWESYVPLEKRPQIFNPACGYVYNVNHNPMKCTCENEWPNRINYDTLIGFDKIFDDNTRSLRFREIYEEGTKLSMESLKAIKYDVGLAKASSWGKIALQIVEMSQNSDNPLLVPFKNWNLQFSPDEVAPTLFTLIYFYLNSHPSKSVLSGENVPEAELYKAFGYANNHLMKYFKTVQLPYREFLRFKRGKKDKAVYGGYGMLAARWGQLSNENGRLYVTGGDNFMMFVQYDKNGVAEMESVVPFGSSTHPESRHFDDQMDLFASKGAKKLTFDKEAIYKNAERVYHPMR